MNGKGYREWAAAALSMLLLLAVGFLWINSRWHTHVAGFFTPAGHLQAVASDSTGLLLFFSDVPFGNDCALSADAMSMSAGESNETRDWLFTPGAAKWHFAGFRVSRGTIAATPSVGWHYTALIVPYGLLVIVLAILPLRTFRRALVRRRHLRRGHCLECGYDLRQSPERCPECGARAGSLAKSSASTARILHWGPGMDVAGIVVMLAIAAWMLARCRCESGSGQFNAAELRAGLDRNVHELIVNDAPLDQAIELLVRQTGIRIVKSPTLQGRQERGYHWTLRSGRGWKTPVSARLHDVNVAAALDVLVHHTEFALPLTYGAREDGTIILGAADEMPLVVDSYDVRRLYELLRSGREVDAAVYIPILERVGYGQTPDWDVSMLFQEQTFGAYGDLREPLFPFPLHVGRYLVAIETRPQALRSMQFFKELAELRQPWPPGLPTRLHTAGDEWLYGRGKP